VLFSHWHEVVDLAATVSPLIEGERYEGLDDLVARLEEAVGTGDVVGGAGLFLVGLVQAPWFLEERAVARLLTAEVFRRCQIDFDPDAPAVVALADSVYRGTLPTEEVVDGLLRILHEE